MGCGAQEDGGRPGAPWARRGGRGHLLRGGRLAEGCPIQVSARLAGQDTGLDQEDYHGLEGKETRFQMASKIRSRGLTDLW